ncbi:hypothetical protein I4U23_008984 [Adineta vaga]|nr:hypothetical protein I4U23_008984 [Adineta vaga]
MGSIVSSQMDTVDVSTMNRYGTLSLFIIGIIGNLLSIYIFSRTHLRRNTCVLCLLLSSCFNLIILIFGVLLRCLMGYDIDLTYYSSIFCSIRYYLIYVSQSTSLWLIVLACLDRYLSSSLNLSRRRWINLQRTYYITLCILILSSLSYIEIFFCFEASSRTNGRCTTKDNFCSYVDTASYLILNSFFPSSLMLGFGTGMLINIKRSHQRIGITNRINRRDKQLISMLLLQIIFIVLCMFPLSIMKLYRSLTVLRIKSTDQIYDEYFAYQISIIISYINPSGMFFLYTLHGKIFRIELIRLFSCLRCCNQQTLWKQRILPIIRIHPADRF